MLTDDGREAIQQSNRTRNMRCGQCGSTATEIVDGETIGGMPGLRYRYCSGCGWSRAITKRKGRREVAPEIKTRIQELRVAGRKLIAELREPTLRANKWIGEK